MVYRPDLRFISNNTNATYMIRKIRKTVCSHDYELRSVDTSEFVAFEKCSECGCTRQRDAAEITVDNGESEYRTAA